MKRFFQYLLFGLAYTFGELAVTVLAVVYMLALIAAALATSVFAGRFFDRGVPMWGHLIIWLLWAVLTLPLSKRIAKLCDQWDA